MSKVILFTGGSRSGKSRHALEVAANYNKKAFIATAEPLDGEMQDRISRHQEERGNDFITIEESIDLAGAVKGIPEGIDVAIIDCLTVWTGNLIYKFGDDRDWYEQIDEFLEVLVNPPCDLLIVTNEVGMGIIPANKMSRLFRDVAGALNQKVAALADKVIFAVSGIPMVIKEGKEK